MVRIGFVFICLALWSCKGKKTHTANEDGFSYTDFSTGFHELKLPYQLSDTGLQKNRDTTQVRTSGFSGLISDSLRTQLFGKGNHVRYVALGRTGTGAVKYYLVKATSGSKKAALLLAFNKDQFGGALPFLVSDGDASTTQLSTLDKSYSIIKNTYQKTASGTAEGRDVYDYDAETGHFALILTNPLNSKTEVINPIDTFPRKHRLAGDYVKDKKNFVSVRDGRYPNQLLVFVHLEKDEGACTGELKGDLLLTSSTSAVYRRGGDPCVLSFRFTGNSVVLKEDQGCGSHRGVDCSFDGSFTRKKEAKPKSARKK